MSFFVENFAKYIVLHKIVDKNFAICYSISDMCTYIVKNVMLKLV